MKWKRIRIKNDIIKIIIEQKKTNCICILDNSNPQCD